MTQDAFQFSPFFLLSLLILYLRSLLKHLVFGIFINHFNYFSKSSFRYLFSRCFIPLDFIAKLAALVPKPGVNLTRFHGVFAPNSKHRVDVTPAKRGKGRTHLENEDKTPEQRHKAMTWAQRLKRVFNIDVSICSECGGEAKVIACIEDQAVIDRILNYLQAKGALPPPPDLLPATRASPQTDWFV